MNYEIQRRKTPSYPLATYKHRLDYQSCKKKYEYFTSLYIDDWKECLKTPEILAEIGHLCCFVLWFKNKDQHEYRYQLCDYGILHLLFHCLESEEQVEKHAEYIHELFKIDIKLV